MPSRNRSLRLLVAATATTVAVTGAGVLAASPAATETGQDEAASPPVAGETASTADQPVRGRAVVPGVDVTPVRDVDVTAGDALSDWARTTDTGGNASRIGVSDGVLTHGRATSAAAGFVETELADDVQVLGARVRFAGPDSGSVALVAWQASLVKARKRLGPTPATGMRLVAGPGHWELSVVDGEPTVLALRTYEPVEGAATFEVVRNRSLLYVVDPAGVVTVVADRRVAKLAGPWASWGLSESGPEQVPASIEAVWAG